MYDYIDTFFHNFFQGIKNFIKYRKIIWEDRWWDFDFFEKLIIFKLKDLESHWEKDTHYVGDGFTKKRMQVLLRLSEKIDNLNDYSKDGYITHKKLKHKFYRLLGRNMERFWD